MLKHLLRASIHVHTSHGGQLGTRDTVSLWSAQAKGQCRETGAADQGTGTPTAPSSSSRPRKHHAQPAEQRNTRPPAPHTWLFSSCLGLWPGGGGWAGEACVSLSVRRRLGTSDLSGAIHFIHRSKSTSPQGSEGFLAARRLKSSS